MTKKQLAIAILKSKKGYKKYECYTVEELSKLSKELLTLAYKRYVEGEKVTVFNYKYEWQK